MSFKAPPCPNCNGEMELDGMNSYKCCFCGNSWNLFSESKLVPANKKLLTQIDISSVFPENKGEFMDIWKALEIVHGMAKTILNYNSDSMSKERRKEKQTALDTVEDFIVNNCDEE